MLKFTSAALRLTPFPRHQLTLTVFSSFAYPKHEVLTMPALSPTMTEGKILKWFKKAGDQVQPGDVICEVETDKATMGFEVQEKGFLAKTLDSSETIALGTPLAIVTKKATDIGEFASYTFGASPPSSQPVAVQSTPNPTPTPVASTSPISAPTTSSPATNAQTYTNTDRVIASPLAKTVANERGIDLTQVNGSGPNGRVIRQDVDAHVAPKPVATETKNEQVTQDKKESKPQKPKGFVVPENPFNDITLSSMRKTIANRLSESKQTIPHYYITSSIEMGATNALRNELNKREKENGVKISINDIIIKAMALALRDYPDVNVQWQGNAVRRFKYADVSVAVAIEGGLVTPIVFRADTLGLLDIARRTKDIAKRARESKLDPLEFIGGTSTVSNLGMFGINTVSSIINPPQATILGVGKTEKKLVFQEGETPYRVAEVMDIIASVDHRAVDGALAAQWLNRIKLYLQHPTSMLL